MKYFVCIVSKFDGYKEIVKNCLEQNIYQLHDDTAHKGAIAEITDGDTLLLSVDNILVAYGVAEGQRSEQGGKTGDWNYVVRVKWQNVTRHGPSLYGVWDNTIGSPRSVVKRIKRNFAEQKIQELMLLGHEDENVQYKIFPLFRLAKCLEGVHINGKRHCYLTIPPVQRGRVWNAARVEALWDSLMRRIPIGTFSIKYRSAQGNTCASWDLLDGQQRANAILAGFTPYPPSRVDTTSRVDWCENIRLQPLLWIDLGKEGDAASRYVFRVTTAANPWGYRVNKQDEASDSRYDTWAKREFIAYLRQHGYRWHSSEADLKSFFMGRPYPCEAWPRDAEMPIPFSLITEFVYSDATADFEEFKRWLLNKKKKSSEDCAWNWVRYLKLEEVSEPKPWAKLCKDILELDKTVVFGMNAVGVSPDDIGLYFSRMGRGGKVPGQKEIAYSYLKDKIKPLKESMDSLAMKEGLAQPDQLAHIAMRLWWTENKAGKKYKWEISQSDVHALSIDNVFASFVSGYGPDSFCGRFKKVVADLKACKLLPWHIYRLCSCDGNGDLMVFLLHEIEEGGILSNEKADFIAGAVMFIMTHANNTRKTIQTIVDSKDIKIGLLKSFRRSHYGTKYLSLPVTLNEIDDVIEVFKNTDDYVEAMRMCASSPARQRALDFLSNGYGNPRAYTVLLYATASFIQGCFPDYDPCRDEWSEDGCPWDYDHIIPKSWIDDRYHLKNSIGNLAPLPYTVNRSKSDSPPTQYYPFNSGDHPSAPKAWNELLLREEFREMLGELENSESCAAGSATLISLFRQVLLRARCLYETWYDGLSLSSVLDFSQSSDVRKEILHAVNAQLSQKDQSPAVRYVYANREYPLSRDVDWFAWDWLSCGVLYCDGQYICVSTDGTSWYIGIAKGPLEDSTSKQMRENIREKLRVYADRESYDFPDDDWWYVKKKLEKPSPKVCVSCLLALKDELCK